MLVMPLSDIATGKSGTFRSQSGDWPATWEGSSPCRQGVQYNVEIDIDEVLIAEPLVPDNSKFGVTAHDRELEVCGTIATVFDDGVINLDLHPGLVLVEPLNCEGLTPGQTIRLRPERISLCPTDGPVQPTIHAGCHRRPDTSSPANLEEPVCIYGQSDIGAL